ncbi:response regulator, partial [Thermodesulfobacteriota bacterium]
ESNGRAITLVRLGDILGLPSGDSSAGDSGVVHILILRAGERRIAFGVEKIVDEQEVLVKGLGKQLSRVRNVAGATILGSGKLVPILNAHDLVKSALKPALTTGRRSSAEQDDGGAKSVLVAEDSITSRLLLKTILESAGYQVATAVDGADAWSCLKNDQFDLLVSDVEMPKLGGFELTAKVREDGRLGDLPVVLVTALETPEHRERGIDAGANAYIVKSSFDQSNLVDVVKRLIGSVQAA